MSKNTGDGELVVNLCDECELPIHICNIAVFASMTTSDDMTKQERGEIMDEYRNEIKEYAAQEANKARLMLVSDLAWCLGKLRGLGHPAEHLEKQYGIKNPVIQNKLEGLS